MAETRTLLTFQPRKGLAGSNPAASAVYRNPYRDKAQASILEWMVEDQMRALGVDHMLVVERGPDGQFTERAERVSDLFWAMMAFGNYDLCIAEDEDEYPKEKYP